MLPRSDDERRVSSISDRRRIGLRRFGKERCTRCCLRVSDLVGWNLRMRLCTGVSVSIPISRIGSHSHSSPASSEK